MTAAGYELHQGDARHLDMIADGSVDLIVTSPPYFGQRSYTDDGNPVAGQIGAEPHPQEFLEALWDVTRECWRVLKPTGSMFVNLGDKRSGSGAPGSTSGLGGKPQGDRTEISVTQGYTKEAFGRKKSKQLLPHRYAIGVEDGLADPDGAGWVMRSEIVWSKLNGLPESVKDRVRDNHEFWFHLTKQGDYFSAVDEIREPHRGGQSLQANSFGRANPSHDLVPGQTATQHRADRAVVDSSHPLGRLPGSVWEIATEPLTLPEIAWWHPDEDKWLGWGSWADPGARQRLWNHAASSASYRRPLLVGGIDHFAAFPSVWPQRFIVGWTPSGICVECGQGRAPVVSAPSAGQDLNRPLTDQGAVEANGLGLNGDDYYRHREDHLRTITGYQCACSSVSAPTRPAVVLDPFCGTGTTVMVARALGRHGIGVDLSADYLRVAAWRVEHDSRVAKVRERTNRDAQGALAL